MSLACNAHSSLSRPRSPAVRLFKAQRQFCPRTRRQRRADQCRASAATVSKSAQQLQSWADRHKKQLQNCRVETKRDPAVLVTAASAQPGQSLLSVPDSSWLSLQVVAGSPIGSAVSSLAPWLQLAIFVLFGLSQRDSEWSPYLLSLSAAPDLPVLWTENEIDEIEGTQLLSTVQGYRYDS